MLETGAQYDWSFTLHDERDFVGELTDWKYDENHHPIAVKIVTVWYPWHMIASFEKIKA